MGGWDAGALAHLVAHELEHSLVDTARLLPFLFVTYLAMEALEHGMAGRLERVVSRAGAAGPVVGAVAGAVPQCGFSAMAATLFSGRVVGAGTLVAVLLSTSDEMLPVFVAHGAPLPTMAAIVGAKVAVGVVAGLALDAALRALGRAGDGRTHIHELCEQAGCHCEEDEGHDHGHGAHGHGRRGVAWGIARAALVHTLQVAAFILLVTLVMGLVVEGIGTDAIAAVAHGHPLRAVLVSGLVGLVPNCAASVVVSELYLAGSIGAGAMLAGLLASGGVGLAVLFRTNRDARESLAVTLVVYAVAVVAGLVATTLGVTF